MLGENAVYCKSVMYACGHTSAWGDLSATVQVVVFRGSSLVYCGKATASPRALCQSVRRFSSITPQG